MFRVRVLEILRNLFDLVFPNQCVICGENLQPTEQVLCLKCLYKIPRTNYHLLPDNVLEKRFWGKADIERATAFFSFKKARHIGIFCICLNIANARMWAKLLDVTQQWICWRRRHSASLTI